MPQCGITGSDGISLNVLRNFYIIFHNIYTSLTPYQWLYKGVLLSTTTSTDVVFVCRITAILTGGGVAHCGFNVHFPNMKWLWAFHIPLGY